MTTVLANVAIPLMVGSFVVLVVLSILLAAARIRHDRRIAVQRDRRHRFAQALQQGNHEAVQTVIAEATANVAARTDLTDTLRLSPRYTDTLARYATPELIEAASKDTRHVRTVRRALGAELLALIGSHADLGLVARILHEDPDRQARRVAARALSRRGDAVCVNHLLDAMQRRSLPQDRLVEQLGRAFAVPVLNGALTNRERPDIAAGIIEALGLAGDASSLSLIARFVRDGNTEERIQACRAMGRLGCSEAVPLLIFAMGDVSHTVRAMAAFGLGELGDTRAVHVLGLSLKDSNWWVRANAGEALRRLGTEGIAALTRALDSTDRFARDRARESLALYRAGKEHDHQPESAELQAA